MNEKIDKIMKLNPQELVEHKLSEFLTLEKKDNMITHINTKIGKNHKQIIKL
jgi:hypothetical protein